jgi:hypothetical protein
MKKRLLFFSIILVIACSCNKVEKAPLGPTDIRVKNITTVNMTNVIVNTGGGEYNFGLIKPDSVTAYHTFDKAYPKANISAIINGQKYKTDTITSYAYMQYLSQIKATFKIYIKSDAQKQLDIDWVPESSLK